MKAEELMIGDLVCNYIDDAQKVVELLVFVAKLSKTSFCPYDELKPIPITPEVLEKNGFKEKNIFAETLGYEIFGDEENSCGLSGWYDGSWEFDMFTPWTETADDGSPEDWGFGTETRITRIKYVHELQHCLKLCGIDKTIEL